MNELSCIKDLKFHSPFIIRIIAGLKDEIWQKSFKNILNNKIELDFCNLCECPFMESIYFILSNVQVHSYFVEITGYASNIFDLIGAKNLSYKNQFDHRKNVCKIFKRS